MTVGELIRELADMPPEFEVMLSVRGQESWAQGVIWEVGGASQWVTIDDYKK